MQSITPNQGQSYFLDKLALGCLFLLILSLVCAGLMRYYLAAWSMAWLIYVPKLLVVVAFIGLTVRVLVSGQIDRLLLGLVLVVSLYLMVGVYFTGSWTQVAFGAFVLLPLLFTVLTEPALRRIAPRVGMVAAIIWLIAAVGVTYDYFMDVPWTGLSYELAGQEVTASRQWWGLGRERVAGFSRASFMAASHLLFMAIAVVILARPRWARIIVWVATGLLIYATTTKKTVAIYLAFTMLLPFLQAHSISRPLKHTITRSVPTILSIIGIALPLSTLVISYQLNMDNDVVRMLFASFKDRLTEMWPEAFELLSTHGNLVLGRGIGGIGVAQNYFEPMLLNTADNMYLYLYVTFGLLAIPLVGLFVLSVSRLNPALSSWDRLIWSWSVVILLSGWATNVLENGFTQIILGVSLGYAFRCRSRLAAARRQPGLGARFGPPRVAAPG